MRICIFSIVLGLLFLIPLRSEETAKRIHPRDAAMDPETWRREGRIIDLHQHIEAAPEKIRRALRILDPSGVGLAANLGAGVVTHAEGEVSEFERVKSLFDAHGTDRFVQYMLLDYGGWDDLDWSERAVAQVEEGHRLGAAGVKEFKRLGLTLKDSAGKLIKVDDPKFDPVWNRCGELGMPISIHVGDPKAFWLPFDESNERWKELKDHRNWWFGDPSKYPPREELLEALNRVIARHPKTTFVCVHFANNPEDLEWVEESLDHYPNMFADLAARIPEIGRHDPERVRRLFTKHQDRILFASDFMVYERLILGSAGDAENPTDEEGETFFRKCWKWFETSDRDWPHMTPIQGDWTISSIDLPKPLCRKIYFDNARKLLAKASPLPVAKAIKISRDFVPNGQLDEPEWDHAKVVRLEYQSSDVSARPELSTPVRILWSDQFLYLGYECPYDQLSIFPDQKTDERFGLWENDVVEAFIASDPNQLQRYTEFEWAPNGESLDLKLELPQKDFAWTAKGESAVSVNDKEKVWTLEARIPFSAISAEAPKPGKLWRLNLYRFDRASKAGLAFSPTLTTSFHTPERFGWLRFEE